MSVRTVSRNSKQSHVRGRLYTATRRTRRTSQRVGRVSGVLMAGGYVYVGLVLAPSYIIPLLFMAGIVLAGGFIMDLMAGSATLGQRLFGPALALVGLVSVSWLMVVGGL